MRISVLYALLISIAILTSACNKTSKIENEAITTAFASLTEKVGESKSFKIIDKETKYYDDSLCILSLTTLNKLELLGNIINDTDQIEYVYIISDGKAYEAFHKIDDDSVYITMEDYNTIKEDKIYGQLEYSEALRYRSAWFVNKNGKLIGDNNSKRDIKIPMPTGTGLWELK